jgi:hypothetical protein
MKEKKSHIPEIKNVDVVILLELCFSLCLQRKKTSLAKWLVYFAKENLFAE